MLRATPILLMIVGFCLDIWAGGLLWSGETLWVGCAALGTVLMYAGWETGRPWSMEDPSEPVATEGNYASVGYDPDGIDGRGCIVLKFLFPARTISVRLPLQDAETLGEAIIKCVRAAEEAHQD